MSTVGAAPSARALAFVVAGLQTGAFSGSEGSGGLPAEGELLGGELLPHGFFDFQHFFHGQFGGVQVAGNLSVEVASGFEP